MRTTRVMAAVMMLGALAACEKKAEMKDTTVVPAMDTTKKGAVVPTTDTVVKTTTTDTIKHAVKDTGTVAAKEKAGTQKMTKTKGTKKE